MAKQMKNLPESRQGSMAALKEGSDAHYWISRISFLPALLISLLSPLLLLL